MPRRVQEIEEKLKKNEEELYNMLDKKYRDNDFRFHHHSKFDELLEERDALVRCAEAATEDVKLTKELLEKILEDESEAYKERMRKRLLRDIKICKQ